ncbi:sugar ABC transporter permease [Streptomyces sp. DSM 44915]|uniref:Sugar ABC transporter permease n=1 Tax=Streptomyces chisholmiae TaxID=3075540 RepID=A0ABU2JUD1_9ACTN|nr:sugar ABC transporter permease [Streptomyces sp. DSM 44915]MDT0268589.1 sugar ABC transporter permease [Streptomyces sp. DSM 44915]
MSGRETAATADGGPRRSAARRLARNDAAVGLAFVAPAVIGVIGLGLIPFGYVVWYAFHDWNPLLGEFTWIGFDNFDRLLGDDVVWGALLTTFTFTALLMVLNISLALLLAVLLNQRLRGITTFRALFFSPVIVSTVAWVLIWGYLVADNGGVNGALALVGIDGPNWLRDPNWALVTVVVIQVFKGVGMNMILFLAALQGVPGELKEASRLDGAGAWRTFRSVTLPLITPTILLVSIITMIAAMDVFVPIQVLTSGGPGRETTVISYLLYQTAFRQNDFGYAAAIGVLLFAVTLALTMVQWKWRRRWVHDEV